MLLLVFGAAVAAGVPVVLGLLGIVVAVGITALLSRFLGINSFTVNMITMIGLAVGIDYTLFIVERFREERTPAWTRSTPSSAPATPPAAPSSSPASPSSSPSPACSSSPPRIFQGMAVGAITVVIAADRASR